MRVVHCKREPYDVYIGRPSQFGNPFVHEPQFAGKPFSAKHYVGRTILCSSRDEAIEAFEFYARDRLMSDIPSIAGKTLGCWCHPKTCHGDVIIKICRELGLI